MKGRRSRVVGLSVAVLALAAGCWKPFDFDNDNKADFVVREYGGRWRDLAKPDTDPPLFVGAQGDKPVPADYDANGSYDVGVVRANGDWVTVGGAGTVSFPPPPQVPPFDPSNQWVAMVPVPADYDGDHRAEPAWYRDTDGTWFIHGQPSVQFGTGPTATASGPGVKANDLIDQDVPVPADYDGDGKADLSTYNPRTRVWRIRRTSDGAISSTTMLSAGGYPDFPVPADVDGVGHAQRTLFGDAGWRVEGHPALIPFQGTDIADAVQAFPTIADYDGDGRADLSFVSAGAPSTWITHSSADPARVTRYPANRPMAPDNVGPVAFGAQQTATMPRLTLVAVTCVRLPAEC